MTKEVLAVAIDLGPWAFQAFQEASRTSPWRPPTLGEYWSAICEFLGQYKTLHAENTLIVIAGHSSATQVLFRGVARDLDIETIRELAFGQLLPKVDNTGISLMTLVMSQCLCHLNLCRPRRVPEGRMLVLVCDSGERAFGVGRELLSTAFAAKALNVVIDMASVYPIAVPAWSQICHETGGCYLNLANTADVKLWSLNQKVTMELQKAPGKLFASMLAFFFLYPVSLRRQCTLFPTSPVDYVATCFCHQRRVLLGYTCSSCFSSELLFLVF
eukprot:Protomagalhaensia_sp_Gyna_25__44@NODE_1020_length_2282_cov_202_325903_g813_i0_p1_GENE_NODE_1020_length_2282_cov_202_325903_g813_i0NODE_1020_length_2282_cov_202_325903_g813_i0_p1_ORF_typecomplete_len272_score28_32Tfb4/PF03850_14/4_3e31_NODE_1020_length_2282_cov_202_325903_g813_i08131628